MLSSSISSRWCRRFAASFRFINFHTSAAAASISRRKKPHFAPNSFLSLHIPKAPPNSTPSINPSSLDESAVLESLSCYSNDYKRGLEFFHWVETDSDFEHTSDTYNRMIDILGKFFEFDLAWNLIDKMSNSSVAHSLPNHTTFRVLFKRYASAHLVKEAIGTYHRLEEFNLKDEISFSNLIDALCEYKHVIEAEELCFGKNKNIGDDDDDDEMLCFDGKSTKIHNMILRGWFKMGRWRKCREFWEEMDKRSVVKDLYSYSICMDIQCKSGKPWKAVKLYKEMKRKGIKLDAVAYNTVFRAIGMSDGVDVAIRLYREMIELGVQPSVSSYNIIVKFLCESGRFKEAYDVLDKMTRGNCLPDVITFHCFFASLEKPREILQLFDRMFTSGVFPKMDTYVLLMRKFERWGFLRPIFVVWKKMEEQGLSPNEFAYNALIDALLQKGMTDMARKYDDEMLAKGLSAKPRAELRTMLVTEESAVG